MQEKRTFAIQSLLVTLVLNAVLLGAVYYLVGDAIAAANQMIPFWGLGVVVTLILWFLVQWLGGRAIESAAAAAASVVPRQEAKPETAPAPPPTEMAPPTQAAAIQLLAILQRQGRLIDFLQENLDLYEDAQIGAAVRSVHQGCKAALDEHVQLAPIFDEAEGSEVTLPPGFDAYAVRLTGDVSGDPPFTGALRHRGWRVVALDLPERTQEQEKIVAPAEIEVGGA